MTSCRGKGRLMLQMRYLLPGVFSCMESVYKQAKSRSHPELYATVCLLVAWFTVGSMMDSILKLFGFGLHKHSWRIRAGKI